MYGISETERNRGRHKETKKDKCVELLTNSDMVNGQRNSKINAKPPKKLS